MLSETGFSKLGAQSHDEYCGVQEQIDAVVEEKILEALCGAESSEMVKVPSCSCFSKAFIYTSAGSNTCFN